MRNAIGIDLGGTNIKGGIVSEVGKLLEYRTIPSNAARGAKEVLRRVLSLLETLFNYSKKYSIDISGVGVVTPGVVDPDYGGVVGGAYNIPGWCGTPFMKVISEEYDVDVFAHNDVTGTVLAEYKYGAGRGKRNIILAAFGTGIGGGIIIDGKLYSGASGYAGEIGHMVIHAGGYKCTCGIKGCWEEYASIRGILRTAKMIMRAHNADSLGGVKFNEKHGLTPPDIFTGAEKNDPIALEIVDAICRDTAIGVGSLINIFNPDMFIIGGGISKAGKIYLNGIKSKIANYTLPDARKSVDIVATEIGYEAGLVGAAVLVFEGINGYFKNRHLKFR
ncbi:MAG: hypothetical protein DRP84_09560 [Spirochaetes bacterium]|nr:MAG: hypothetical protein DRP84_09560 [Spirochaetota bacterium]